MALFRKYPVVILVDSGMTGVLIYFAVYRLLVRPMLKMTRAVTQFAHAPEQLAPFQPSGRADEIGKAERALEAMQETVSAAFRQKKRTCRSGRSSRQDQS